MSERAYGYKYDEMSGKYLTAAEIAKLMRRDIKQAIDDGLLPAAGKYRVRVDNYAGGRSIDITVQDFPNAWEECDGYKAGQPRVAGRGRDLCPQYFCAARVELCGETRPGAEIHQRLTEEAEAAQLTLERIHSAYNHDGSDSMVDHFDVNYYGQVSFETAGGAAFRAQEAEKKAARRQAINEVAAESGAARRVLIYGSGGRKQTVHDAVTVNGRERLVCGATLWSHSVLWPAAGSELTCSRCAKREAAALALPVRAKITPAGGRWVVAIVRGAAELESHLADDRDAAFRIAGEAIARIGGAK